jgi:hypothetical protein
MPAPLRITLTEEEDRTLSELRQAQSVPYRTRDRAHMLRLNAQGMNVPAIAEVFQCHQQTVRATLKRWQQHGLGGLWEAPGRGAKAKWQPADLDYLTDCLAQELGIASIAMNQSFFNRLIHLMQERPLEGKRILGLPPAALWELWQRIAEQDEMARRNRAQLPTRQRQAGGGRKKEAMLLCRLLVTLLYLRQHWTMQGIAEVIACAESTVCNYIHEILPYLRQELPASLLEQWQQDCTSVERAELEHWLAELPEGALLVDTWEQPIPRPSDRAEQEAYYSGKQKQHTRKNQAITLPHGTDLVDVVLGEKGPRSDSKLLEQTQAELPAGIPFVGDKAYVGRAHTTTPKKRPPKGALTQAEKDENRRISQQRVFVEHVIRIIKVFRIAKEVFRMRSERYETAIGCVCGLVRLRAQYV